MMTLKIGGKDYSVKFNYNCFCDTDLLDRVNDLGKQFAALFQPHIPFQAVLCYTDFRGVGYMAGTWFCPKCYKDMGDNEYCPYCGSHRMGDMAMSQSEANSVLRKFFGSKPKKEKQPIFSEEECFLYGIHPDDEMYRKTMELDILSKNYKR